MYAREQSHQGPTEILLPLRTHTRTAITDVDRHGGNEVMSSLFVQWHGALKGESPQVLAAPRRYTTAVAVN